MVNIPLICGWYDAGMKWKHAVAAASCLIVAAIFVRAGMPGFVQRFHISQKGDALADSLSLVTEPDDGIAPVLAMIDSAKASLDLVMYELDDAQVETALAADKARGVAVRVILNGGYKGSPPTAYTAAYDFLKAHGVPVRYSPGYFSLTHEKSLVIDGERALIMTFNLVSKYYATGRDFGIVDADRRDVAAMEDTFGEDWRGSGSTDMAMALRGGNANDAGDGLLWSPGSEPAILDLIGSATRSLSIYNEEMADMDVTKALIDATRRGVAVYVVMTGSSQWKWDFAELVTAGAHGRIYADADDAPLYIHAKMVVADAGSIFARAFVGSENFSKGSLDENRELGLLTEDRGIIAGLMKTFAADWRGGAPFLL